MAGVLQDRVAVVTGAGRGLGRAVAEAYAAEGATVVVSDVDASTAAAVADSLDGAESVPCDVTAEDQVSSLVSGTVDRHGRIDVMVANAGIAKVAPLAQTTLEDWRAVMAVNLDGVFLSVKHAGLAMAGSGGGAIVNMASITGMGGLPMIASYASAKAAVISLTKTAALELRDSGVRVNAICPGFIATDLVGNHKKALESGLGVDLDEVMEAKQGGYGAPEDVARLAVFLASARSDFCTGGAYVVDGGATASLL